MDSSDSAVIGKLRFRFGIFDMFMLVTLAIVFASHIVTSRELRQIKVERRRIREEIGYLNVDDKSKAYIRPVPSTDPLTWKTRIYLPKGSYRVCVAFEWLEDGFPKPLRLPRSIGGGEEFILTAGLHRSDDGVWSLSVWNPDVGSRYVDKEGRDWLGDLQSTYFPSRQGAYSSKERIPLVRQKVRRQRPPSREADGAIKGLMIWIEPS
jgi:hypothetical protein